MIHKLDYKNKSHRKLIKRLTKSFFKKKEDIESVETGEAGYFRVKSTHGWTIDGYNDIYTKRRIRVVHSILSPTGTVYRVDARLSRYYASIAGPFATVVDKVGLVSFLKMLGGVLDEGTHFKKKDDKKDEGSGGEPFDSAAAMLELDIEDTPKWDAMVENNSNLEVEAEVPFLMVGGEPFDIFKYAEIADLFGAEAKRAAAAFVLSIDGIKDYADQKEVLKDYREFASKWKVETGGAEMHLEADRITGEVFAALTTDEVQGLKKNPILVGKKKVYADNDIFGETDPWVVARYFGVTSLPGFNLKFAKMDDLKVDFARFSLFGSSMKLA